MTIDSVDRLRPWLAAFAIVALVVGCGTDPKNDPGIEVTGRLLQDGKPLKLDTAGLSPGSSPIRVEFIPTATGGVMNAARVNPTDATFVVKGFKGAPFPPGKYKIAITIGTIGEDKLNGKFSPLNTPIVRDVAAGQEVVIDLAKP